jgi:hypothetical protein
MAHLLIYVALATKICVEIREISEVLKRVPKYKFEALGQFAGLFINRELPNFWRELARWKNRQDGVSLWIKKWD